MLLNRRKTDSWTTQRDRLLTEMRKRKNEIPWHTDTHDTVMSYKELDHFPPVASLGSPESRTHVSIKKVAQNVRYTSEAYFVSRGTEANSGFMFYGLMKSKPHTFPGYALPRVPIMEVPL